MKFRCERDALAEALGGAARAATGRTSHPVLNGVRLQLSGDRLVITGTDLELTIEHDGRVALGVWPLASLDLSAVLYALLLEYVGRPLEEIGALPVPP